MPLLRHRRGPEPSSDGGPPLRAPALEAIPADHVGAFLCADRSCPERAEVACRYTDRAARSCLTAWCGRHHEVVDGLPYCRRHAGIMRALGSSATSAPLPGIDNRAPSLLLWMVRGLDEDMRSLLAGLARQDEGERVVVEPIRERPGGRREPGRWEHGWLLSTDEAVTLRVGVEVGEASDPEIIVRVGRDIVARQVPPWILHRIRGTDPGPGGEERERRQFFRSLHNLVAEAAARPRRRRGGGHR